MRYYLIINLLITNACLYGQQRDTTFKIYSTIINDSFSIKIGQFINYPTEKSYYAVYTLDGDETFIGTKLALNSLKEMKKNIILISIGYGAHYGGKSNMRDRDYRPIRTDTSSGGRFLNFISNELIPIIEHNYTLKKERTLIGYSAGANFCLYTLLANQSLFSNYLAGSIGASLDSGYFFNQLKKVKFQNLKTKLFISSGSKENSAIEKMNFIVNRLSLKKCKSFLVKKIIFEGQEHGLMGAFTFIKESLKWALIDN